MSHDILRDASRALREVSAEDNQGERFTRARVMASLHQRRQRRTTRLAFFIPLAAILVGSTAWAGASGKFPQVWDVVTQAVVAVVVDDATGERAEPAPRRPIGSGAAAAAAPAVVEAEPPEVDEESEPTKEAIEPEVAMANAGGNGGGKRRPKPAAGEGGPDPLALYRAAHRAHFGGGDRAAALGAWDKYLAAAPGGRFAVEARYNRALCLLRLGRHAEARAALAPFARGTYGGYRQQEATDLLKAAGEAAP